MPRERPPSPTPTAAAIAISIPRASGRRTTRTSRSTSSPIPERYLIQNWIISFPDGRGAYEKDATAAKSSNWHLFRAPDQEWERTHYQRQSKIETMVQSVIANARKSGAPKAFDKAWLKILQTHLGAWKHAEFGLGTSLMQAQRYGYTQMINNATLTNSSYKLRLAQDITLYLAEIGMDVEGWNDELGKKAWLEDGIWQGTREAVETIMGATDYLEQYFATNIVFEPLVGELFRSGFLMQVAAANHDFITPPVISAAEADYERNLANTIDLIYLLANDEQHAPAQSGSCSRAGSPSTERSPARRPRRCSRSGRSRIQQAGLVRGCPRHLGRAARQDSRRTRPHALNRGK